jgi:TonB-dependent receptor
MDRQSKGKKKDRTGVIISIAVHAGAIGIILFIISRTEIGRELWERTIGATREERKAPPPKREAATTAPKAPPKVRSDAPPPSAGPRRATDAPAAVGEGLVVEDRTKVKGPATGRGGTNVPVLLAPPPPKQALRPLFQSAATPSTVKALLAERSKAAASIEAIGSEQIAKSGVSDAGAVVTKVSGATIAEGKFAVIRGLSDRYVTTTLNGAEIPSADPYRRSASLDLFPAQIISKVVVSKTFTPDQQGAYTGGGIDIVTKSFPEKAFLSASVGVAYNTQSSRNDQYLVYQGGHLDWLGFDDGTRALPAPLAGPSLQVPPLTFSANPRNPNFQQNVNNAETLNQQTHDLGITQFAPTQEAPPLNQNFSVALGETTHLFEGPLGVFGGLSYKQDYAFYTDGISRRYNATPPGVLELRKDYSDTRALELVNWSAIVSLAYQIYENHELGFNFLYNQNAVDDVRHQSGATIEDPGVQYDLNRLAWTERSLQVFQMKGAHRFPEVTGLKFDWMVALSDTSQDEPNTRFFNFGVLPDGTRELNRAVAPEPRRPTRYYRDLEENNRNTKLDFTLPVLPRSANEGEFKFGLFDSTSEREFFDRELAYDGDYQASPWNGNPNDYLTPDNLGYTKRTNYFANGNIRSITYAPWKRYIALQRDSSYDANAEIQAGYLMLDLPLGDYLRLIGGVRYETTFLRVDSVSTLPSGVTGKTNNTALIDQDNLLPAASLVFAIRSNMNLRLSYSETLARPSFRELAAYRSYDPILDELLEGNPRLVMTSIKNYDVRWEWFPRPGELFGVSFFYKDLKEAIEREYLTIDADIISFDNRPTAEVLGVEFEARKSLDFLDARLKYFSLGGNLSLIQSETELTPEELAAKAPRVPGTSATRPLYDQSPYILNLDFSYDNPRWGTSASVVFNVAGPRITIASLNTEDVYEQPAPLLDFVFSQRLGRHATFKFTARNLLDPEIQRTYGKSGDFLYSSYKRGMTFGFSLGYDF